MARRTQRQSPGQLQMFMTPREIKAQYSSHIGDRKRSDSSFRTDEEMWAYKHHENQSSGLTQSVALSGVQFPVGLGTYTDTEAVHEHNKRAWAHEQIDPSEMTGKPMVTGGHHRIEAAYQTAPDTPIPVLHHTDILEHQGWPGHVPESHKEFANVKSQGGTNYRMPIMVGMKGYENPKVAQPWGHYR